MGTSQKYTLVNRLFPTPVLEGIDQHLMEVYQMEMSALMKLKAIQPNEYRKIRDEELVFLGKAVL